MDCSGSFLFHDHHTGKKTAIIYCKCFLFSTKTNSDVIQTVFRLQSSANIIRLIIPRRLRWAGHIARVGESTGAYRVLVGKPEGRRSLGRPRYRREVNIKIYLREKWEGA
jgi:hypothetical protein